MTKKKDDEKDESVAFDFGFSGFFNGLGKLIDSAVKLAEKGEELKKTGEIKFEGPEHIKGLKDLKGIYGFRVSTLSDGRPSVQSFGNIKKKPTGPVVEEVREPIVDVFDEPGEIHIVAEMPGVSKEDIHLELAGDILDIRAEGDNRKYQKEVLLSRRAEAEDLSWTYKNGILDVKVKA